MMYDESDLERTIRDEEFTRKARKQIRQVVTSESFLDLSCDEIMLLLRDEMEQVSFRDYLKRYLYRQTDMQEPFRSIPDRTWQQMIDYAFEENGAPRSFEPTSTRWTATVKNWLNAQRVRRSTVFLLGFGLRMPEKDVSEMLTKVLMEDDFRMYDPREVIFRYCFANTLPYSAANSYLEQYEKLQPENGSFAENKELPRNEAELLDRLAEIKGGVQNDTEGTSRRCFLDLYQRCCQAAADIYNQDEEEKPEKSRREWHAEDITPADLEQMLCSGIPLTPSGNLAKANLSQLCQRFESFRPSRQHMDGILRGTLQPDRYDLLTLSFFLHAQTDVPGRERLHAYLEETNAILASCQMSGVYPAHAYEAFLLICIVSDCPMAVYTEIWEMSYQ